MPKILITEDDHFLATAYNAKLTKAGFETLIASDGDEALAAVKSFGPDLILLDLIMPHRNGFSVLEELAKSPETSKIPVIVLSNLGQKEDQDKALQLGAKDYIVKTDTTPSQVVEKIQVLLG